LIGLPYDTSISLSIIFLWVYLFYLPLGNLMSLKAFATPATEIFALALLKLGIEKTVDQNTSLIHMLTQLVNLVLQARLSHNVDIGVSTLQVFFQ